ncbi:uncharacterized protein LOC106876289 [Octopus bimaculoides]|uniref:Uncharacterized protein n=1 Tax=Octopus bimaculoides TaxID=37653 RepID=A0A0L8GKD2_OCTBM|nr:uncharacterized protein LOC106876289 [Octopus bimaculoides]|eukprot:XP_014780270.1 PREDICTED: uncharacterized protein LOC106876289 [Octopus bimaculoides]
MVKFPSLYILLIFFYAAAQTLGNETEDQRNDGLITNRVGAESLLHRLVEDGHRPIYENGDDGAIMKMSRNVDESRAEESISKCENFSDNIGEMNCNGSNFHYTCYQVTGIHYVGLYITFDIRYDDYFFRVKMTMNDNQLTKYFMNGSIAKFKSGIRGLPIVTANIYDVVANPSCRHFCVDVTTTIRSKFIVRNIGCFIDY